MNEVSRICRAVTLSASNKQEVVLGAQSRTMSNAECCRRGVVVRLDLLLPDAEWKNNGRLGCGMVVRSVELRGREREGALEVCLSSFLEGTTSKQWLSVSH